MTRGSALKLAILRVHRAEKDGFDLGVRLLISENALPGDSELVGEQPDRGEARGQRDVLFVKGCVRNAHQRTRLAQHVAAQVEHEDLVVVAQLGCEAHDLAVGCRRSRLEREVALVDEAVLRRADVVEHQAVGCAVGLQIGNEAFT